MAEITVGRILSAATDSVKAEQSAYSLPWIASNPLVPVNYDKIMLGYTGDVLTSVYYYAGLILVATLSLAYSDGKLTSVSRV